MSDPRLSPPSRRRKVAFMILTPLLTILVLLILAEAVFRVAGVNPLKAARMSEKGTLYLRESADSLLRYEPNPGFRGGIGDLKIRINAAGFRGREIDSRKEDHFRIAILGDSIVFGKHYLDTQIFPAKLEKHLQRMDKRYEVLNLGVEGYDTLQEVRFLKRVGLPLDPDWVVLCFCLNDVGITPFVFNAGFIKPRLPILYNFRVAQWIGTKLHKLNLQADLAARLSSSRGFDDAYDGMFPDAKTDDFLETQFKAIGAAQAAFAASRADKHNAVADKVGSLWLNQYTSFHNLGKLRFAFQELRNLSVRRGFKVLVAVVPFLYKIDGAYLDAPAHAIVRREAEMAGLGVIDLLEALDEGGLQNHTFDGVHLNNIGHDLMAKALYAALAPRLGLPAGQKP
jgi:lysophospholipase L1-like esterase